MAGARAWACFPGATEDFASKLELCLRHFPRVGMERFPITSNTLLPSPVLADNKRIAPRASVASNIHVKLLASVNHESRCILFRESENLWSPRYQRSPGQVQIRAEQECRELMNVGSDSHAAHDRNRLEEARGTPLKAFPSPQPMR